MSLAPQRVGAPNAVLEGDGRALAPTAALAPTVTDARAFVLAVGLATFGCGFLAGALLNLYLLAIHDPLVAQLRASLSYESAILGDGLILPIVNMTAARFIAQRRGHVGRMQVRLALLMGLVVTGYFHIDQAMHEIVNWAMPTPWHWNAIGLWHALYMLAVTSWLSLFLLLGGSAVRREKRIPGEAGIVLLGLIVFFALLRLDYHTLALSTLLPHD